MALALIPGSIVANVLLAQTGKDEKPLTVQDAQEMITTDSSVVVLDVRTEEEFKSQTGHLANAILIPVQELEKRIDELAPFKDRTIIAYCRTGRRSEKATAILVDHGYKALNMKGGIVKWNETHLPVVNEKKEKEREREE
jgi:rhodanese-related sulfurtransferase